jgi:hypothetical protein
MKTLRILGTLTTIESFSKEQQKEINTKLNNSFFSYQVNDKITLSKSPIMINEITIKDKQTGEETKQLSYCITCKLERNGEVYDEIFTLSNLQKRSIKAPKEIKEFAPYYSLSLNQINEKISGKTLQVTRKAIIEVPENWIKENGKPVPVGSKEVEIPVFELI